MTYYDDTIRKRITEQLKGYRSMLEQTLISASDQNLHLLANERIKQLDELLKIIKPSPFDFLTKKEIRKIQESRYKSLSFPIHSCRSEIGFVSALQHSSTIPPRSAYF